MRQPPKTGPGHWLAADDFIRVAFAVTGVLTWAVMLGTMTSSLANVDYTA